MIEEDEEVALDDRVTVAVCVQLAALVFGLPQYVPSVATERGRLYAPRT